MDALITSHEAESIVRNACSRLGAEAVPLTHAFERVLAELPVADRPLLPYPRAMMDGIAFLWRRMVARFLRRAGLATPREILRRVPCRRARGGKS
ncbi:MAG: hypothetical protein H7A50_09580 [Akkermansiaceae bacterium]|nr:hypothetical protein [Akkermansiaceae bacterium]